MQAAQISAKPLGDFFDRMAKKEGGSTYSKVAAKYEILSSHPALGERARNAHARPTYPTEPILSEAEWQALRGMCKGPMRGGAPKGASETSPTKGDDKPVAPDDEKK